MVAGNSDRFRAGFGPLRPRWVCVHRSAPLARRWWLQAGFSFTHYSNGGSQQPNWGINQLGGLLFVKYDLRERQLPATRRTIAPYEPRWELSTTFAMGVRNLAMDLRDDPEYSSYLTKDYAIGSAGLAALVPDYLPAVPPDPFTGRPLSLRRRHGLTDAAERPACRRY